jgi:uncharacterized membrane protein YecN with MAPEG domain
MRLSQASALALAVVAAVVMLASTAHASSYPSNVTEIIRDYGYVRTYQPTPLSSLISLFIFC